MSRQPSLFDQPDGLGSTTPINNDVSTRSQPCLECGEPRRAGAKPGRFCGPLCRITNSVKRRKAEAHARNTDPETSHEAAKSVRNFTATYQAIVALIEIHGSLTDSSIEALYSGPRASSSGLRTRRSELCSMGIIRDSGVRKRLDSGRWSILWELV